MQHSSQLSWRIARKYRWFFLLVFLFQNAMKMIFYCKALKKNRCKRIALTIFVWLKNTPSRELITIITSLIWEHWLRIISHIFFFFIWLKKGTLSKVHILNETKCDGISMHGTSFFPLCIKRVTKMAESNSLP